MPRLEDLKDYRRHAEWALATATGLELGLVDALAEGPRAMSELASELGLSFRGTETLLGALAEVGVVRQEGASYRLTGSGRGFFLESGGLDYQRPSLLHWLRGFRRWTHELSTAVRNGTAPDGTGTGSGGPDPEAVSQFMQAMANKPPGLVEEVVEAVLRHAARRRSLIDLGGGPGSFARGFAERGVRTTLLDRPEVIALGHRTLALSSVENLDLVEGDFLHAIPGGPFDIVFAANVTHIYSADVNRRLVRDASERLAPGGLLAIVDFVRGGSEFAALFAITMLLATEGGGTYTLDEYSEWLGQAGLSDVRCEAVAPDIHLVTATKPDGEVSR